MLHDHVELDLRTYTTLLAEHNLGEAHITLIGSEEWRSYEEQREVRAAATAELNRLGLMRNGRVDNDFLDTLNVLQRPATEYYTWALVGDSRITLRTAITGRDAVIAAANRKTLYLSPGNPDNAALEFAMQLPDTPAASVHSASCAFEDYQALTTGNSLLPGANTHDAKQIHHWLEQTPWDNKGQLFAAIRDGRGERKRNERVPSWFNNEAGRFLVGTDNSGWVNLTGASTYDIAERLHQLEAALRGR